MYKKMAVSDHGDSGRVVTAVFKAFQTIEEDRESGFLTNIRDDTAHRGPSVIIYISIGSEIYQSGF